MSNLYYESSLSHYGVRGQKWGVRRFQSSDGRLTSLGRKRNQVKDLKRSERDKTDRTKARLAKQKEKLKYEKSLAPDEHPILDATKDKVKKTTQEVTRKAKIEKIKYDQAIRESNKNPSKEDVELTNFMKSVAIVSLASVNQANTGTKISKETIKRACKVKIKDIGQDVATRFDEFKFR